MRSSLRLLALAIGSVWLSSAAISKDVLGISAISGEWRISKAELADRTGVQAYSDDQLRALVGNRLLIDRKSARWRVSHGRSILREHDWLAEKCADPTIEHRGQRRFIIRCSDNVLFAPDPEIRVLRNGLLKLEWWDGVDLYLHKIK